MSTEQIEVGGLRIAFQRAGKGPPLVLLHGALSDSRTWRRQLDGFSGEFTVVAWDAPGCGQSSDPPSPETFLLSDFADCLAGFIEALSLENPHVLGLSFGGGLALELYRRYPTVPRTLVLASAYAGWAGSLPPEEVEQRRQRALREADLPPEQWVDGYLPGLFTEAAPQKLIDEAVAIMYDTRPAGMKAMTSAFAEADLRDVLLLIEVPTLLLYGDADRRSPPSVAEDLHTRIPTSKLVLMPGVGHCSNLESPEIFNTRCAPSFSRTRAVMFWRTPVRALGEWVQRAPSRPSANPSGPNAGAASRSLRCRATADHVLAGPCPSGPR